MPRSIRNPATAVPSPSEALILASVTMGHSGPFFERVSFYFESPGRPTRFRLDSAVPWTIQPMLESTADEGLEPVNGRLYAFTVPPGTYALTRVVIHDVPQREAVTANPITFAVGGGSVTYIGNLHVELCHLQRPDGPSYVTGGRPEVNDHGQRDLPLMISRHPRLQQLAIEKRVLDDDRVRNAFRDLSETCDE